MKRLSVAVAMLFAAGTAAAATTPTHSTHHTTPKISRAEAEKTALAKVPGGTVKTGELEHEHGKLVYSFDIAQPGKSGVEEVQVDAHSGKVISKSHETAKKESGEKAKEEKAQTKPKSGY